MNTCPNCHLWVSPGASDCSKCGALIREDGSFERPRLSTGTAPDERFNNGAIIITLSLLTLVLVPIVFKGFYGQDTWSFWGVGMLGFATSGYAVIRLIRQPHSLTAKIISIALLAISAPIYLLVAFLGTAVALVYLLHFIF